MATPKKKKQSIREFVSEDALKFQLYLLKYSNQLRQLNEKTEEEIITKWNYDTNKRINRFNNDLNKPQYSGEVPQEAIQFNIEYVKAVPAPTNKEGIHKNFEKARSIFIESLEKRIEENTTATHAIDKELLDYAKEVELKSVASKEKFGVMLLLIIKNLSTMPSFSGYSDNWKTDFFSNAIEKTLLYLDNFDENLLSKRTGNKSNAFAYVTQICFNAFVNIINIRKKEDSFLKDTISLETANLDGMKSYAPSVMDEVEEEKRLSREYKITIKSIEELDSAITRGLEYIKQSNEILFINSCNFSEIEDLEANTPEEEKTEDFDNYIADLSRKIVTQLENIEIDTLKIVKPVKVGLGDWEMWTQEALGGISLIITDKVKRVKKVPEPEPEVIEEIRELDEFDDEW